MIYEGKQLNIRSCLSVVRFLLTPYMLLHYYEFCVSYSVIILYDKLNKYCVISELGRNLFRNLRKILLFYMLLYSLSIFSLSAITSSMSHESSIFHTSVNCRITKKFQRKENQTGV